jgi:hypothetical protein
MELKYKPNFEETKDAWRHFWAGETWRRPIIVCDVPKDPAIQPALMNSVHRGRYYRHVMGDWKEQLAANDALLENTYYAAESMPYLCPDFGPDQFAAFLGAEFHFSSESRHTNWVEPIVSDWADFEVKLDPENRYWKSIQELAELYAEHAKGRYLVGICDLHSNGDALSALRSPQALCMDFYDQPARVAKAMADVRKLYQPVYDGLYNASGLSEESGGVGWAPLWSDGKFATIQCDFICMVSPEISREYIIPALEEEASFLDHCVLHLDGPGALRHLDDILAIKAIDAIQWVPGDGQPVMWKWSEVLEKCRAAGKGLQMYHCNSEQVKAIHKEMGPKGMMYTVASSSIDEVEELATWLENHM